MEPFCSERRHQQVVVAPAIHNACGWGAAPPPWGARVGFGKGGSGPCCGLARLGGAGLFVHPLCAACRLLTWNQSVGEAAAQPSLVQPSGCCLGTAGCPCFVMALWLTLCCRGGWAGTGAGALGVSVCANAAAACHLGSAQCAPVGWAPAGILWPQIQSPPHCAPVPVGAGRVLPCWPMVGLMCGCEGQG